MKFIRFAPKFALALLACNAGDARALVTEEIDVRYRDRHYELTLVAVLDAPLSRVQAVLRDYGNYPNLDSRILEANVMSRPTPDEALLYTKLRACFGIFCRTVKRVERVREREGELEARVLPEQSEATRGDTTTHLTAFNGRTRVRYQMRIAPGFWIPAFVGRSLLLRTLREASLDLFRRVESTAQREAQ